MKRIILGNLFVFLNLYPYFSNCQGIFMDSTDEFTFERVLITEKTRIVTDSFIQVQFGKYIHTRSNKAESVLAFRFNSSFYSDGEILSAVVLLLENDDTLLLKENFDTLCRGRDIIYLIEPSAKSINLISQIPVKKIRFIVGDINRDYEILNRRIFMELIQAINARVTHKK